MSNSPPKTKTAVLLTALEVEGNAVRRQLSDIKVETVGGTKFFRGTFESWDVAVAEIGAGNPNAAAITTRACGHYKPLVALFVGVAGGVKDVNIGDVVVATKVYGYDSGKDKAAGIETRPDVMVSSHPIEQSAKAIRFSGNWLSRLYKQNRENPRLFVGPIAAGEKVVASKRASTARLLKKHYGDALAIEMEGRGFLSGVHINEGVQGGVIRGISDLLSGKVKADQSGSQERAAGAAAAVAFEILSDLDANTDQDSAASILDQNKLPETYDLLCHSNKRAYAHYDRNGWSDWQGHVLELLTVEYMLPTDGTLRPGVARHVCANLRFRNNAAFPFLNIHKAYWLGYDTNEIDIPIGESREVILGHRMPDGWLAFQNDHSVPAQFPYKVEPRGIPFREDSSGQFNHFDLEVIIFSSKTGQVFSKYSAKYTAFRNEGFSVISPIG